MNRTWKLTDTEFVVLWEATKRDDFVPHPFVFTCRTPDEHEYRRQKQQAWDELRRREDRWFEPVMAVLAEPDIRIVALGHDGADPWQSFVPARVLGVRRGDVGYVVSELSGETWSHSGGFTVTECDAINLADAVVRALPEAGPGAHSSIVLPSYDAGEALDYSYGRSSVRDTYDEPIAGRAQSFLAQPASCVGTIRVQQGHSRFGPRGIAEYRMRWRDVIDDGRYVIVDGQPPVANGVDAKGMVTAVNVGVAEVVRAIKDERR